MPLRPAGSGVRTRGPARPAGSRRREGPSPTAAGRQTDVLSPAARGAAAGAASWPAPSSRPPCSSPSCAVFNLLTDPWGVFGVGIFPPRVNQDRSTKADLLTGLQEPPELLIYGSSRAWTVEAARVEQATGLRTFNAAVTAGRPADAYVFTEVVHDRWPQAKPDFLWLLDVEAFLRGPLPPSLLAESRFSRYLPWRAKAAAQLDELGWLASWTGLQASYEVWKKHPTREKVRASWLKRISPDGTVKTPPSSEAKATAPRRSPVERAGRRAVPLFRAPRPGGGDLRREDPAALRLVGRRRRRRADADAAGGAHGGAAGRAGACATPRPCACSRSCSSSTTSRSST